MSMNEPPPWGAVAGLCPMQASGAPDLGHQVGEVAAPLGLGTTHSVRAKIHDVFCCCVAIPWKGRGGISRVQGIERSLQVVPTFLERSQTARAR